MALTLHGTVSDNTAVLDRRSAKPIFINGAMEIWQRGTALASSSGSYAADRFWYAGTGMTSQRNTDAPSGFNYSNKLTYGSADMAIGQPIELPAAGKQGMFIAGQKITIAFYGKVDSGTEAISVVINARNSKFSGTNSTAFSTSSDSATLTTDWQRFTNTFTIPTINANNIMLAFELAGISKTAYFTGFQAELGEFDVNSIPPFQHESFGDSLSRCQRYFQIQASGASGSGYANGSFRTNANAQITHHFKTDMRTSPTCTQIAGSNMIVHDTADGNNITVTSIDSVLFNSVGGVIIAYNLSGTSASAGDGCWLYNTGSTPGVTFDSEL